MDILIILVIPAYQDQLSTIPISVHHYLEQLLDCDSRGKDNDLREIAQYMPTWKDKPPAYLKLTDNDIAEIKHKHSDKWR